MNIFQYFEASGKAFWIDEKRETTWFKRDGGVVEKPWGGGWERWLSENWYNQKSPILFDMYRGCPQFYGNPIMGWIDQDDKGILA